jgi:tetratricopeptide (TPR) repeat protein
VELDSGFALAYAELARVQASMIHFGSDVSPERLEAARAAAVRAIELAPNDVRSHIAMGFFQYHALKNYPEAERAFARAAELRPRDPELLRGLALVQRRHGQFRASTRNLEAAIVLNPRDINLILDLLDNYISGARWRDSARYIELAMTLSPDQSVIRTFETISIWGQTGSTDGTREVLESAPDRSDPGVSQYGCMLEIYEGTMMRRSNELRNQGVPSS